LGIVIHLKQSSFTNLGIDLRLRQAEHNSSGPLLSHVEVGLSTFGEAKGEHRSILKAKEGQRAITTRFSFSLTRDTLLDEAAADQTSFWLVNGRNECRVTEASPDRESCEPAAFVDASSSLAAQGQSFNYHTLCDFSICSHCKC